MSRFQPALSRYRDVVERFVNKISILPKRLNPMNNSSITSSLAPTGEPGSSVPSKAVPPRHLPLPDQSKDILRMRQTRKHRPGKGTANCHPLCQAKTAKCRDLERSDGRRMEIMMVDLYSLNLG